MGICNGKKQDNTEKSQSFTQSQQKHLQESPGKNNLPDKQFKLVQISEKKLDEDINSSVQKNTSTKKPQFQSLTDFDPIYIYLTDEVFTNSIILGNSFIDLCKNPNYKNANQMLLLSLKISSKQNIQTINLSFGKYKSEDFSVQIPKKILYKFNRKLRPALSILSQQISLDEKITFDCLIATVETYHVLKWFLLNQEDEKWFEDHQIYLDLESQYTLLTNQINLYLTKNNPSIEQKVILHVNKNKKLINLQTTKEEKLTGVEEMTKQFLDSLYSKTLKDIQFIELSEEIIEFENYSKRNFDINTSEIKKKQASKTYRL